MIPILAGTLIRYWQGSPARYWQGIPILAGIAALALATLGCAAPWAPMPVSTPAPILAEAPDTGRKPDSILAGSPGPILAGDSDTGREPGPLRASVSAMVALNVRQGPSERTPGIGVLYSGELVEISGDCSQGWAPIVFEDGRAWVNARYLSGDVCKEEE